MGARVRKFYLYKIATVRASGGIRCGRDKPTREKWRMREAGRKEGKRREISETMLRSVREEYESGKSEELVRMKDIKNEEKSERGPRTGGRRRAGKRKDRAKLENSRTQQQLN